MNRSALVTFSLATAVAVMTLGYANPSFANKPDDDGMHNHGGDGKSKNDTSDCQIDFSVTFDTNKLIRGDRGGSVPYPDPADSKDKSGGGTGAGPGFRFDTNGKGPLESARDTRFLVIKPEPSVPGHGGIDHLSGADFRFHLPIGGLDLCSLDATASDDTNASGEVPMTLGFVDDGGTEWMLLYDCIFHDTNPIIEANASGEQVASRERVTVKRNAGAAGGWSRGNTWTITGTKACLISRNNYATATPVLEIKNLDADFIMTIEAQ